MRTHSWSRKARMPAMIAEEIAARIRTLPIVASQPINRGHAIPLQDAEREGRDGKGRRNVAERDRQEKDDGKEEAGRADDPLRDRMEQHRRSSRRCGEMVAGAGCSECDCRRSLAAWYVLRDHRLSTWRPCLARAVMDGLPTE